MASSAGTLETNLPVKQKLCVHYGRYGHCVFGHRCRYAHNIKELANPNALLDPPAVSSTIVQLPYSNLTTSVATGRRPIPNRMRRATSYGLSFIVDDEEQLNQLSDKPTRGNDQLWTYEPAAAEPLLSPQPSFVTPPATIEDFSMETMSLLEYPRRNYQLGLDQFSSSRTMLEDCIQERFTDTLTLQSGVPKYEENDDRSCIQSSRVMSRNSSSSSSSVEDILALLEQARRPIP
ncbi:hypothetical protein FOL47_004934 [Perkinsus chesapeaki]|uniref:C3H1-type domain-containing protein n=1 Tax=Perkinsus chesapeaki TaxID=330153 RepID=A0A7J6LZR6_PERCH|nr:hypothetical protein FOL47_004934 [Perkinsus chesapeaki]